MSAPAAVTSYVFGLLALFVLAFGVGHLVGPLDVGGDATTSIGPGHDH